MKYLKLIVVLLLTSGAFAQVSVNGGFNLLKSFSPVNPYMGFHLGVEIPRDDAVSLYGRYSHGFSQSSTERTQIFLEPRDVSTLPPGSEYYPVVDATPTMNYNIIEGGTRYYLGNGFDYGFAAYGGTNLMIIFNKVKLDKEPYDEVNYKETEGANYKEGSVFSLGFGLGGGVKYTMAPYGTFYFDVNLNYLILAQPSHQYVYMGMLRQLLFTFNLGFRKDIIW